MTRAQGSYTASDVWFRFFPKDQTLLKKVTAGDMIATDSQYHLKCLQSVYQRVENSGKEVCPEQESTSACHGIPFAHLVSDIQSFEDDSVTAPVFRMLQLWSYTRGDCKALDLTAMSISQDSGRNCWLLVPSYKNAAQVA